MEENPQPQWHVFVLGLILIGGIFVAANKAGIPYVSLSNILNKNQVPAEGHPLSADILSFSHAVDLRDLEIEITNDEKAEDSTLFGSFLEEEPSTEETPLEKAEETPFVSQPLPEEDDSTLPALFTNAELNAMARQASVNILCTTNNGGLFKPTSGSGIIISPSGVILTNAHVAQYFLLEEYQDQSFFDCIVRIGSPAQAMYRAELLYISKQWITENAFKLKEDSPMGNGENDYALLLITERTDPTKDLPESFPYVRPNTTRITEPGMPVLVAGYPAGFLSGQSIQKDLYITSTITDVENVYTFNENTIDLITLGGVILAQGGASGSPVVDNQGQVTGLVVTSTEGDTTGERNLGAITLRHVDRSLQGETGQTLPLFLQNDLKGQVEFFANTLKPELISILEEVLE